jgi:hypothetical protein
MHIPPSAQAQRGIRRAKLTCELAHMRTPPIGANKIPTMKNRGSTLLGVRIGLSEWSARSSKAVGTGWSGGKTHCHAFNRCCRNAVSVKTISRVEGVREGSPSAYWRVSGTWASCRQHLEHVPARRWIRCVSPQPGTWWVK